MAQIAATPQRRNLALWSLAFLGLGLLSILPLSLINPSLGRDTAAGVATFNRVRVAYFEFDINADTLWLADPNAPASRIKSIIIPHAPEYGVIPSLSPDHRSLAYTVLPPETPAPGPDAPAALWVASLDGGRPSLVAADVDLLVPPVWSPDGRSLIFRRSDDFSRLLMSPIEGGAKERGLQVSANPLFPVGFGSPNDFYYVEINEAGSQLHRSDLAAGAGVTITLSEGLTRDWTLSPDGSRIAYLEMTFSGQQAAARAFVLDLSTGERVSIGDPSRDAFNPTWDANGSLVVGQSSGGATVINRSTTSTLRAPARGFDVPLATDINAGTAVTSFDGDSVINPGRASLVVVGPDGSRREIASGEVTFLGWITP